MLSLTGCSAAQPAPVATVPAPPSDPGPSPGALLRPDEPGVAAVQATARELGIPTNEISVVRTRIVELPSGSVCGDEPAPDPAPQGITFGVEVTMQVGQQRHLAVVSPQSATYCGPVSSAGA